MRTILSGPHAVHQTRRNALDHKASHKPVGFASSWRYSLLDYRAARRRTYNEPAIPSDLEVGMYAVRVAPVQSYRSLSFPTLFTYVIFVLAGLSQSGHVNAQSNSDPTRNVMNRENRVGPSDTATTQTPDASASVNGLDGLWLNKNPDTRGLVRIIIEKLNIHPFGACRPSPCDWGIIQGTVDSRDATAIIALERTTFSETTLRLIKETDGRLRIDAFTHFTDGSERADHRNTDYFTRDPRPALMTASRSPVSSGGNSVLVVWEAGSPQSDQPPSNNVPPSLQLRAESMGLQLQIRTFPARGFAQEFHKAFAAHREPDIVAVENGASIDGPENNPSGIVGIASYPEVRRSLVQVNGSLIELAGVRGGRQFLVSTSEHAEAARRFALRPPDCDLLVAAETSLPPDLQQAAMEIADAYLRSPAQTTAWDDPDRLATEGTRWDSVNATETKTCSYWGNDRLAFVSLLATFEHEGYEGQPHPVSLAQGPLIGQMPILLVLRRRGAQWLLLAASSDPWSNEPFLREIQAFSKLLHGSASKQTSMAPAKLLSPDDGKSPVPDAGQRFGDFTWQPSPSSDVVAQIAEFAYQNDDRLFFLPNQFGGALDRVSDGLVWNAESIWKWRVWSISDTGAIAFSDYRTFRK